MTLGDIFVYSLLALNVAAFFFYLMSIDGAPVWRTLGRTGSWLMLQVSGLAVFYLALLFLHDQFAVKYVFDHSARSMEPIYKLSALWAGQEGTFLLWLFFLCAVSVILTYTQKEREGWTLLYMKALEMMLCVLLIASSPFALMGPGADITDGTGMNALLMNPWMVIHPPVMFLGYAAAAAPFAIFLAGSSLGDPRSWVRFARGWTIISWALLGIGIFLGMYWSYEVLGWGGYWAWDPVENASLFAWIILCGALHGMILQKSRKNYVFWTALMVSVGYITVVFSTFLTRSGVLANFSLHSFQGLELYRTLLYVLILTTALAIGALIRTASLLKPANQPPATLRSMLLSWSIFLFWIFFIFVFIGTTMPILSGFFSENPSPVQGSYYNLTSLIPGIPIAILLYLCPVYYAGRGGAKASVPILAAGPVAGVIALFIGIKLEISNAPSLIFLFASTAAAVTNGIYFLTHTFSFRKSFASYMSHLGIAVMFAGFIFSSLGSKSERVVLFENEFTEKAGMKISLRQLDPTELGAMANLVVTRGSRMYATQLEFILPEYQRIKINTPTVIRGITEDIYLSPVQVVAYEEDEDTPENVIILKKQETQETAEDLSLTFKGFDRSKMEAGVVGITILVKTGDNEEEITLDYGFAGGGEMHGEKELSSGKVLKVTGIDAGEGLARIEIADPEKAAPGKEKDSVEKASDSEEPKVAAVFNVSIEPYIGMVWAGMILLSGGALLAAWRRFSR